MEKIELRKKSAHDALKFLEHEIDDFVVMKKSDEYYQRTRNSVIHSFEFSLESFWKYVRIFLYDIRKVDTAEIRSPRSVLKAAAIDGILSRQELRLLLDAVESRNETTHAYLEEMAERVVRAIVEHAKTLRIIINRLEEYTG